MFHGLYHVIKCHVLLTVLGLDNRCFCHINVCQSKKLTIAIEITAVRTQLLSVAPDSGQNTALRALFAATDPAFLITAFRVRSTSFPAILSNNKK